MQLGIFLLLDARNTESGILARIKQPGACLPWSLDFNHSPGHQGHALGALLAKFFSGMKMARLNDGGTAWLPWTVSGRIFTALGRTYFNTLYFFFFFYFLKIFFFFGCGPFLKSSLNLLQHCCCVMFWFVMVRLNLHRLHRKTKS